MIVFRLCHFAVFDQPCLSCFSRGFFGFGPGRFLFLAPLVENFGAGGTGDVVEDGGLEAPPEPGFFDEHGRSGLARERGGGEVWMLSKAMSKLKSFCKGNGM